MRDRVRSFKSPTFEEIESPYMIIVTWALQGGPAKVRPAYIFDGNSATFIETVSYSQSNYYKLKG